jgi:hypothetical protein
LRSSAGDTRQINSAEALLVGIFARGRAVLDATALVAVLFNLLDGFRADSAIPLHGQDLLFNFAAGSVRLTTVLVSGLYLGCGSMNIQLSGLALFAAVQCIFAQAALDTMVQRDELGALGAFV